MGGTAPPEPRGAPPPGRWARLAAWPLAHPFLVAGLAAAAAFANTLWNEPNLDDTWAAIEHPLVRTFDVARMFREEARFSGGLTVAGPYRPLALLTHALNYALGGPDVRGFHAVNVAIHVACTLLVVALARRLLLAAAPARARSGALGAGLLFALHPVHVEAVAPLVGRADLLAAALGLSALGLALGWREARWRLPVAVALLALGMLAKETAAVVPGLFALVAVALPAAAGLDARPWPATPAGRRSLLAALGVALALGLGLLPYLLLRPGQAEVPVGARWFEGRPPAVVFLTMTRAVAEYLRLLAWPVDLMSDFGYAARIPFTERLGWAPLLATAAWGGVALAGLASLRTAPLRALGLLWAFVALAPVLNVVPVGVLMAERFLYLASVGLCVWAGQGPAALAEAAARAGGAWPARARLVPAAAAAVLALLVARTLARNAEWRDPVTFNEAELRFAPRDVTINNNLAVAWLSRGEPEKALERARVALTEGPGYWRAHLNLGLALARLGRPGEALGAFQRAAALAPAEPGPRLFEGALRIDLGDLDGALASLARAAELGPNDPRPPLLRARVLAHLGRREEARVEATRALRLDPALAEARALAARLDAPAPASR